MPLLCMAKKFMPYLFLLIQACCLRKRMYAILKRFAKVFEQAYVRFLDLKKAEAQAREAMIEASLERIRAQSNGHASFKRKLMKCWKFCLISLMYWESYPCRPTLHLLMYRCRILSLFAKQEKVGRKSFGEQKVPIDSMDIWKDAADKWRGYGATFIK